MEPEEHLQALDGAGAAFADLIGGATGEALVPTCPGWDARRLIRHLGTVHRWAATIVAGRLPDRLPFDTFDAQIPDAAGELRRWFREGHARLLRALREAPPDLDCWSFLVAPAPRAFWCRRQAHETAIHLVDLALALGLPGGSAGWVAPPAFAADGVNELLQGWMRGRPPAAGDDEEPSLRVIAVDQDLDWQFSFPGRRGVTLVAGAEAVRPAACTVRARAVDLYSLLWNRRSVQGLEAQGDITMLDRWGASRQV